MDTRMNVLSLTPVSSSNRPDPSGEGIRQPGKPGNEVPEAVPLQGNRLPVRGQEEAARELAPTQQTRSATASEEVSDAVDRINDFVQVVQRDLRFTVDEDTGRTVVKVLDSQSEELIRQLPPEEILELAAYMDELRGLLVKEKA